MTLNTPPKAKERFLFAVFFVLICLIGVCLCLELFFQDQLRSGITVDVVANEKMNTVNEDLLRNIDAYLHPLNIFSYFTQLSNTLVLLWSIFFVFSRFLRKEKWQAFCDNPIVLTCLTTYVTIAGATVFVTMLLGLSQFQTYKNVWSLVNNLISLVYHFVTPLCMWAYVVFLSPAKTPKKKELLWLFLFPFVYSLFTILRGIFIRPGMYPYFIFSPKNIWEIVGGDAPIRYGLSYLVMALLLSFGAVLFYAVGRLLFFVLSRKEKTA